MKAVVIPLDSRVLNIHGYWGGGFFSAVFYCMSVHGHGAVPKRAMREIAHLRQKEVLPDKAQLVSLTGKC